MTVVEDASTWLMFNGFCTAESARNLHSDVRYNTVSIIMCTIIQRAHNYEGRAIAEQYFFNEC